MIIHIVSDKIRKDKFNKHATHPMQSWEWGEARIQTGLNVVRIGEYANKKLKNVFTITLHPIPYTKNYIGYIPRSVIPSNEVIDFLRQFGQKNRVVFYKFEPNQFVQDGRFEKDLQAKELLRSSHPLFPKWTQTIDLTQSESQLFSRMKSKTRYNIRLAKKKGVVVKEMNNEEGFNIFLSLYFETCKRQHYFGHNKTYHQTIWKKLNSSIAHLLVAFYQNTPLAVYELFLFNNTLYYPYGGSSTKFRNVMATNLLMWEAIRMGKKRGAHSFDLWGSRDKNSDTHSSWSGFTKFKEGYATTYQETVGSWDLVIQPFQYKVYTMVYTLRNQILLWL